jgi:RimJ/RimL family protein N-acetyltransferase
VGIILYPVGHGAGLGSLEPWHAEHFAAAVDHAREFLTPWIPFAHTVTDVKTAREFLQRFADGHAADALHIHGIWMDGRLVGGALFPRFDTRTGVCELGVWLTPTVESRGLITKAAGYLVDWAIRERSMSRVEWHNEPSNERSKAVAQRLGMTFEGIRRSAHPVAQTRQDAQLWSLLADEWPTPAAIAAGAAPGAAGLHFARVLAMPPTNVA